MDGKEGATVLVADEACLPKIRVGRTFPSQDKLQTVPCLREIPLLASGWNLKLSLILRYIV